MPLPSLVVSGQVIASAHINAIRNYLPLMADGTAGTPGLRFEDDPDTGLHRPGSNQLAIVTGGAVRVTVSNTGVDLEGHALSDVGVVTLHSSGYIASPALVWGASDASNYQLTVGHTSAGSSRAGIGFRIDSAELWQLVADNADGNKFKLRSADTTDVLAVDSSGKVGIGTASPVSKLEVGGGDITAVSADAGLGSFAVTYADGAGDLRRLLFGIDASNARAWMQAIHAGVAHYTMQINPRGGNVEIGSAAANVGIYLGGTLKTLSVDGSGFVKAT